MRALATAFVAVFLCLQPASAQECVPPGVVYAQATSTVPNARMLEVLRGPEAHWVTQNYNAIEPISAHVVDGVAVVIADGAPVLFLIGFTAEGCTVFADTVPIPLYQAWRRQGA